MTRQFPHRLLWPADADEGGYDPLRDVIWTALMNPRIDISVVQTIWFSCPFKKTRWRTFSIWAHVHPGHGMICIAPEYLRHLTTLLDKDHERLATDDLNITVLHEIAHLVVPDNKHDEVWLAEFERLLGHVDEFTRTKYGHEMAA